MFVFLTYLPVFLLKFRLGELVGCKIWFRIQRVPTMHTFDGPRYPKNKKYLKKCDDDIIVTFFQVFLVFGVEGSTKSMPSGYSLDAELIPHPTSLIPIEICKTTGRYVENTNKKVDFFFSSSKINKYYFIILTIILLFSLGGPFYTSKFL